MRRLAVLLLAYGAASLVHFVHNAEIVAEYPAALVMGEVGRQIVAHGRWPQAR